MSVNIMGENGLINVPTYGSGDDGGGGGNSELVIRVANGTYDGRNLADVFDKEISGYSNEWEWMLDRVDMAFFDDLLPADYIQTQIDLFGSLDMQIAGIDPYLGTTGYNLGHHIDFISRDCLNQAIQWRTTSDNNGNSESASPYMLSNVKAQLNGAIYEKLPDALKNVISNKILLIEGRYSNNGKLDDSNSWVWSDLGKLWIPTEYEVAGSVLWGGVYSQGQSLQYPIFKNSWKNRIKKAGSGGNRCNWSLATVKKGNTIDSCLVDHAGYFGFYNTASSQYVPICFRIAKK